MSQTPHEPSTMHIDDDLLNELVDNVAPASATADARLHLGSCETCRTRYDGLIAIRSLLQTMPEPRPGRSFQLSPEMARPAGRWNRFLAGMNLALPALRAATVAVALLLVATFARDAFVETDSTGPVAEESAQVLATEIFEGRGAITTGESEQEHEAVLRSNTEIGADDAMSAAPAPTQAVLKVAPTVDLESANSAPAADSMIVEEGAVETDGDLAAEAEIAAEDSGDASDSFAGGGGVNAGSAGGEEDAPGATGGNSTSAEMSDAAVAPEEPSLQMAAEQEIAASPSPATPAATPATPQAVASPSPMAASSVDETFEAGESNFDAWRTVQISLGILLVLGVAAILLAQRIENRRPVA